MLVVLSQKIDSESSYSDELFNSYHYPAKYKNQLHKGDTFIYYQGNRFDKEQRYYFGVGTVGEILSADGENYYAKLINCQQFAKKVPIYLPNGGYVEQLGYETVRNSINPPWQSSIRPISQMAFDYILNVAGVQQTPITCQPDTLDSMKEKLKQVVKAFYVEGDRSAIHRIESIAAAIGRAIDVNDEPTSLSHDEQYSPEKTSDDRMQELLAYCKNMRMSYSYKPILILALLHHGDKNGCIKIEKAAKYFRDYYAERKRQGLCVEKKKCIYLRDDITDGQIISNLISNPVRALVDSGLFFFNEETKILSVSPEIWTAINRKYRAAVTRLCNQKLCDYYGDSRKESAVFSKEISDSNELGIRAKCGASVTNSGLTEETSLAIKSCAAEPSYESHRGRTEQLLKRMLSDHPEIECDTSKVKHTLVKKNGRKVMAVYYRKEEVRIDVPLGSRQQQLYDSLLLQGLVFQKSSANPYATSGVYAFFAKEKDEETVYKALLEL